MQDVSLAALVTGSPAGPSSSSSLVPGLQELTGSWSGSIQVWGDDQGAADVEFSLQGRDWK